MPIIILIFVLMGMGLTVGYYFLQNRQTTPGPASASNLQINITPLIENTETIIVIPTPDISTLPMSEANTTTNSVTYSSTGFSPSSIIISVGGSVTWANGSGSDLDLASSPHPTHSDYPPLNLGIISPEQSMSLIFPTAGTYTYHNHLVPTHFGSITVQ